MVDLFYAAYVVDDIDVLRRMLEARGYWPQHPDGIRLHHVTYQFPSGEAPPPLTGEATIVGYCANAHVECFVVNLDGSHRRADGGVYHLTFSVGDGHDAVESNDALATCPVIPVNPPVPLTLHPEMLAAGD